MARDQTDKGLSGTSTNPRKKKNLPVSRRKLMICIALLGALGVILFAAQMPTLAEGLRAVAVGLLVASASISVGALLGFVFGIPRRPAASGADSEGAGTIPGASNTKLVYVANTNIEEISDWLTKILVGVGLTQLTQLPDRLNSLTANLANMVDLPNAQIFIGSVLIYYLIGGFFFGYLITRIYLSVEFLRSEIKARKLDQDREELSRELQDLEQTMPSHDDSDEEVPAAIGVEIGRITKLKDRARMLQAEGEGFDSWQHISLARQLRRIGSYDEALSHYQSVLSVEPGNTIALVNAGVIMSRFFNNYDGAEQMYLEVLKRNPNHGPSIYNMACNEARRSNFAGALDYLKQALNLNYKKYAELSENEEAFILLRLEESYVKLMADENPEHEAPITAPGTTSGQTDAGT